MTRNRPGSLACVVAVSVGVSLLGCADAGKGTIDSSGSAQAARDTGALLGTPSGIDWDKVVDSAENHYTYALVAQEPSGASNAAEFDEKEDPGVDPHVTFARATLNAGATPYGKIIGKIVSTGELKKLKIEQGTNYLWHAAGSADIYTVPRKHPSQGKRLKRGGKFSDSNADHDSSTHLVKAQESKLLGTKTVVSYAFGVCTDDCPSGHCGLQ